MGLVLSTFLADTPRLLYRLGEASGSTQAQDSSGNNFDLAINGGVTPGIPGPHPGDPVTGMLFDGQTGWLSGTALNLPTGNAAWTIEAWVLLNQIPSSQSIIASMGTWNVNNETAFIAIDSSGKPQVGTFNGNHSAASALSLGIWHQIIGEYDGTSMYLTVDGSQVLGPIAQTMALTGTSVAIGSSPGSLHNPFNGSICDVSFYAGMLSAGRTSAHYLAGLSRTSAVSPQDLTIFKHQVCKAYLNDGVTFLGTVPDVPYLQGFTEGVNAATSSITVTLPRKIDAFDGQSQPGSQNTVVLGNIWKWYIYGPGLPTNGLLRYQGIVDTISPKINSSGGESVDVTITPYSQILGDHGVIGPINFGTSGNSGTYQDTMALFNAWFNGTEIDAATAQAYGTPFTLDPSNPASTGNTTFFSFQNQNLLAVFTNILLLSPANWYFRFNDLTLTASFNQYNLNTPNHYLKIGQHFSEIQYSIDNVPRKNEIVVVGSPGIQAIARGSSIATIGKRTYQKQDSRITDSHTATLLANGLLAFYDRPQVRTKVVIPDYRGDTQFGLGYDIEAFKVGQTVTILDPRAPSIAASGPASQWGSMVWGRDKWSTSSTNIALWGQFKWGQANWGESVGTIFNTIVPIVGLTYHYHSVELELGFKQPGMLRALARLEAQYNDTTLVS